ncbi:MAG: RHS repeat-associated core domain-containing protein [Crocinitomicaceae bacterium]|nr:RHS repeat-associated core domain-containing protein [Crocinitomicaceae bacterium]
MATYDKEIDYINSEVYLKLKDRSIYGSSRVGVRSTDIDMLALHNPNYSMKSVKYEIGKRTYELSNHLGNVLSVISDKPIPSFEHEELAGMLADVRVAQDYSPFGVTLSGRSFEVDGGYRYSFQGQESDDEVKGRGNSYDFGARMYDSRLGRFFAVDPLASKFPSISPYAFCIDNPIYFVDPDGRAPVDWYVNHSTGEYTWFDGNGKKEGYTGVGYYKVIYDRSKNMLNIYSGKESTFVESLDMSTSNGKYKTDQAAKFALISAETGGTQVKDANPTVQPLIIGAIIDNRLSLGKDFSTDGTVQGIKGFQAMSELSYSDFKYGNEQRFGLGESAYQKKNMNIGLSTVYTATLDAISILNKYYPVAKGETKQFEQMLYYAHKKKGNTVNGDFDIAIPSGTEKFQYVRGDNKYKEKLDTE